MRQGEYRECVHGRDGVARQIRIVGEGDDTVVLNEGMYERRWVERWERNVVRGAYVWSERLF